MIQLVTIPVEGTFKLILVKHLISAIHTLSQRRGIIVVFRLVIIQIGQWFSSIFVGAWPGYSLGRSLHPSGGRLQYLRRILPFERSFE
jgi:hypothetical protein